jgi:predicted permease
MENSFIMLQKLLVLFGFMLIGSFCYKKKWISEEGGNQVSGLIVHIFNPALIISGMLGTSDAFSWNYVIQNLLLAVILFAVLIIISPFVVRMLGIKNELQNMYCVMLIFSNLGFMGIPLIQELYGKEAVFLVAIYILVFNTLFYTYGVYLFEKEKNKGGKFKFQWKKMLNPGMLACLFSIGLFVFRIQLPALINGFFDYLGTAAVPLSMMMTGVSLAKIPLKYVFTDWKMYPFAFVKMLVIPIAAAFIIRQFQIPGILGGIMVLMFGMPNGSMPVMLAADYGLDSTICSRGVVLTTLLSLVTLPVVTYFVP